MIQASQKSNRPPPKNVHQNSLTTFRVVLQTDVQTMAKTSQGHNFQTYYAALLPRRGPHIASHSVCPSVCLSVCPSVPLSLPSVTSFRQPLASRMYFSARTEGIRTLLHALRAAYRTAISAVQILVQTTTTRRNSSMLEQK